MRFITAFALCCITFAVSADRKYAFVHDGFAYTYSMDGERAEQAFELPEFRRTHDEPTVSPNASYIASIHRIPRREPQDDDRFRAYRTEMAIVDAMGDVRSRIPHVLVAAWSPDSTRVVYITGRKEDGFGFHPDDLGVVNVESGEIAELGASPGFDLSWAKHDNGIYVLDWSRHIVTRVDPDTGERAETGYKGIFFSPDGRYLVDVGYEGSPTRLFETETGADISETLDIPEGGHYSAMWSPTGSRLMFITDDLGLQVWDVEQRKMTLRVDRAVNAWWHRNGKRVFIREPIKTYDIE